MRRDRDETVSKFFIRDETEMRQVIKFCMRHRVSVPLVSRPRRDRDSRPSLSGGDGGGGGSGGSWACTII